MTTTIELPDEKAQHLLNILDRNAQADSIERGFYWADGDIDEVRNIRDHVADELQGGQRDGQEVPA